MAKMSCDYKIKILSEKEVLESIYGKGFGYWRMKLPLGSSVHVDASKQSVWANMPPELLRAVLMKIEESESFWPERQDVVACAGVCRNWRDIMKDIVKPVKISRMLTFPESVKQPGPRDKLIQCYIYRDPSNQSYHLYLSKYPTIYCYGKFLLSARKYRRPTCTDYNIYLTKHNVRMNNYYIGKLSSNIIGTKFIIYDTEDPKAGQLLNAAGRVKCRSARVGMKQVSLRGSIRDFPIAHISYELNVLGSRVPRRMHCVMTAIPLCAAEEAETEFVRRVDYPFPLFRSKSVSGSMSTAKDGILMLKNKTPKWHEQLQCWCLNFNGRVTVASVKNFQLVACVDNTPIGLEPEKVVLQFGKVGKDVFTLDYQYPLSAFQAFAICLTSFDTKIASDD